MWDLTQDWRQVMVAIDGSDAAERALRLAAELARVHEARLVIVHACPPRPEDEDQIFHPFEEAVERGASRLLTAAQERVRVPADRVETRVVRGVPGECLSALAEELEVDVVVVGSRGRGKVVRSLLGSVSDRLLHGCARPVLVVH